MKEISTDEKISLVVAEYNTLRAEILKRSENRYQILSLNLVMAGTILTFGLQQNSPSYVLFIFCIVYFSCTCLVFGWIMDSQYGMD